MVFLFFQILCCGGQKSSLSLATMKSPVCGAVLCILLAARAVAFAEPDYAAIGRETVSELAHGQWPAVEGRFDERMKAGLPQDKLESVWHQITAKIGEFEHITSVTVSEKEGYHTALIACEFANADLDAKVVVDTDGHITGLFFVPPATSAPSSGPQPDYSAIGRSTVSALANGQFAEVESRFDHRMKNSLPESQLSAVWQQITAKAGPFDRVLGVRLSEEAGYHVALVSCAFAHVNLDTKVVMDSAGHIAGLFFLPAAGQG
jgi:hypothetical protein